MSLYSIDIKNFRGIKSLNIEDFKNINLFVGRNNCGKTSILESIFLSIGVSNPQLAINIDSFRGIIHNQNDDFNFIFYNLNHNNRINIKTQFINASQYRNLIISPILKVTEKGINTNKSKEVSSTSTLVADKGIAGVNFEFSVKSLSQSRDNFLKSSIELQPAGIKFHSAKEYSEKIIGVFLNPRNYNQELHERLDKIIQRKEQKKFIKTLKAIDPRITDIALGSNNMIYFDIGIEMLIPIQLMGDGISRLLSIMMAMASFENGIILIDEIENGLHASALEHLWSILKEGSETYNVQIFATTHSLECVKTFSNVFNQDLLPTDTSRLFRIEKSTTDEFKTFKYNAEILKASIDSNWEVR